MTNRLKSLLLTLAVLSVAYNGLAAAEIRKPNIVFILADDLGYGDLASYNPQSDLATPHIDSLAADGVRFTRFYAASNVCAPSRRAILTGRYPSRLGEWAEAYRTLPSDGALNPQDEPCFPLFLRQAGYVSGMFGKWNIGSVNGVSTPDAQGFDTWLGSNHSATYFSHYNGGALDFWENGNPAPQYNGQFADDVFVDKAISFITENRDRPFFVYLPLFTPHAPFQDPADPDEASRPDLLAYTTVGGPPAATPSPTDRPVLKKMVEHIDQRIGDLLQTIKDLGLEEDTIIIFTSDNGGERACINTPLRGFKQQMTEGGTRVPTMIKWPGVYPAGRVSDQAGIAMDLTRTLLAAGRAEQYIPTGRQLDGIDLTPLLTGNGEPVERPLFWRRREWSTNSNVVWAESYILGDWKYLREFGQIAGYARSQVGTYNSSGYLEALFNLKDDIAENQNLAEVNPEKLAAMSREYEIWREGTVNRHRHYQIPVPDQYGSQAFSITADLLAHWPFDGNANDLRGQYNLTLVGDATPTTAAKQQGTHSLALDGTGDYAHTGTTNMALGGQFTIAAWVFVPASAANIQTIAANGNSGVTDGFRFFLNSFNSNPGDGQLVFHTSTATVSARVTAPSGTVAKDQWQHVAAVVNRTGGTATLYRNGIQVATGTIRTDFGNTAPLFLGAMRDLTNRFRSNMDDVRIYSRLLTRAELIMLVNDNNAAPNISDVTAQTITEGASSGALAVTIGDSETAPQHLTLFASSNNTAVVPNANIVLGGSAANRTVTVTPLANRLGSATITLTVNDGTRTAPDTFPVTVNAASPMNAWRFQHFLTTATTGNAADIADGDGDSHNNLLEYALATNPLISNPGPTACTEPGFLTLTYNRPSSAPEINYITEWSATLGGWFASDIIEETLSDNGTLRSVKAKVSTEGAEKKFLRLRVTKP